MKIVRGVCFSLLMGEPMPVKLVGTFCLTFAAYVKDWLRKMARNVPTVRGTISLRGQPQRTTMHYQIKK